MKTVYMCFSTDIIHSGHINIIQKAAQLGRVVAGVLCDRCVAIYEKYPLLPEQERVKILENITGIDRVVVQNDIYYDEVIRKLRPDYVVHGDNWRTGYQKPVRERVIETLKEWGGELVEFPYTSNETLATISQSLESRVGMPETRRQWLQYKMKSGEITRVMEAHDGLSALLVERTKVGQPGKESVYDGLWISSLCDSTVKGKPDTELVDLTARLQTVSQILDVTTKPIVFDMDTGGMLEHFVYNIATIEKAGVSAVIIEDKTGLKRNSLFGTSVEQHQESIDNFCEKIRAGKSVIKSGNFMLIARIESLILKQGLEDALARAMAYVEAGADGIMIHSKETSPQEVFAFCDQFRAVDPVTPIVAVPTTYCSVTEEELLARGVNMVIYANQLLRASYPMMEKTARSILEHHRALESEDMCMSIKHILSLIEAP